MDRGTSAIAGMRTRGPLVHVELTAGRAALVDRIARHAAGDSPRLAGDDIRGADPDRRAQILGSALAEAERLRSERLDGTVVLDTGDQSLTGTVQAIRDAAAPHLPELVRP